MKEPQRMLSMLTAIMVILFTTFALAGGVQAHRLSRSSPDFSALAFTHEQSFFPSGRPKPTPPPTDVGAPPIVLYPAQDEARAKIVQFYEQASPFSGKNRIQHVDKVVYTPFDFSGSQARFAACVWYSFVPIQTPQKVQNVSHEFSFQYDTSSSSWRVVGMDPFHACD